MERIVLLRLLLLGACSAVLTAVLSVGFFFWNVIRGDHISYLWPVYLACLISAILYLLYVLFAQLGILDIFWSKKKTS